MMRPLGIFQLIPRPNTLQHQVLMRHRLDQSTAIVLLTRTTAYYVGNDCISKMVSVPGPGLVSHQVKLHRGSSVSAPSVSAESCKVPSNQN